MAKSKRKISAAQRDKNLISIAKKLKKSGILSKQTKLHSGQYISRGVLAKVRQYESIAALNYGAVKVPKSIAKAAKDRGYEVVQGNRIIGPKTPTFRNRLKKGEITGVKPVRGGYMEEVTLPHSIYDLRSLVNKLGEGALDSFKLPNERFAFRYKGNESYRTFADSEELLEYLNHYKGIVGALSDRPEDLQEEFDSLTFFRLHPNDTEYLIRGPSARERDRRAKGPRQRKYKYKSREEMSIRALYLLREKEKEKGAKRREKLLSDPVKLAEYKDRAKKRAKASRERAKK